MLKRLAWVLLPLLAGPGAGAVKTIEDAAQLSQAMLTLSSPGPPETLLIRSNISFGEAGRLPLSIARNVTLRGRGPPAATELDLAGWVDGWRLAPGVVVTVQNLTLSNLALRPVGAPTPPPANSASRLRSAHCGCVVQHQRNAAVQLYMHPWRGVAPE